MSGPVIAHYKLSTDQPLGNGDRTVLTVAACPDGYDDEVGLDVHIKGQHPAGVVVFKADLNGDGEIDLGVKSDDSRLRLATLRPGVFEIKYQVDRP